MFKTLLTDILNKDILSSIDNLTKENPALINTITPTFETENIVEAVRGYFNKLNTEAEVYVEDALILHDRAYRLLNIKLVNTPQVQESYLVTQIGDTMFLYSVTYDTHQNLYRNGNGNTGIVINNKVEKGAGFSEAVLDELSNILNVGINGGADETEVVIEDEFAPITFDSNENITGDNKPKEDGLLAGPDNVAMLLTDESSPLLGKLNLSGKIHISGGEYTLVVNELSIFYHLGNIISGQKALFDSLEIAEKVSLFTYVDRNKYYTLTGALFNGLSGDQLIDYAYDMENSSEEEIYSTFVENGKVYSIFVDVAEDKYVCLPYDDNVNRFPLVIPEYEVSKIIDGEETVLYNKDIIVSMPGAIMDTTGEGMYAEASLSEMLRRVSEKIIGLPKELYTKYKGLVGRMRSFIKKFRDAKDDEDRDMILNGEFIPEMTLAIRLLIAVAVGYPLYLSGILGPIGAILAGMVAYIMKKYVDEIRRDNAFRMITNEIQVIDEKIEDARANNNLKAKTELIRIKQELTERMRRARFNMPATGTRVI